MARSIKDSFALIDPMLEDTKSALAECKVEAPENLKVSEVPDYIRMIEAGGGLTDEQMQAIREALAEKFVDAPETMTAEEIDDYIKKIQAKEPEVELTSGSNFNNKLTKGYPKPISGASSIIFTDRKPPETATLYDVSVNEDKSVVFWVEDYIGYVSAYGKKMVANKNCNKMFYKLDLETIDLSMLDMSNVTDMSYMFQDSRYITSIVFGNSDTSNVTNMEYMFYGCQQLNEIDLINLNTSQVANMSYMFNYCRSLTSVDLTAFDMSKVTTMEHMFMDSSVTEIMLPDLKSSQVTNLNQMFYGCTNLQGSIDLSTWDLSNVTKMIQTFYGCKRLESVSLPKNMPNVERMSGLFRECSVLKSVNLPSTSASLTDTNQMFYKCVELPTIDISSSFNTSNVTRMDYMFYGCSQLTSIDVSMFDTSKVENLDYLFDDCSNLEVIYCDDDWTANKNIKNAEFVFSSCERLTGYSSSKTDGPYCKPIANGGYFTPTSEKDNGFLPFTYKSCEAIDGTSFSYVMGTQEEFEIMTANSEYHLHIVMEIKPEYRDESVSFRAYGVNAIEQSNWDYKSTVEVSDTNGNYSNVESLSGDKHELHIKVTTANNGVMANEEFLVGIIQVKWYEGNEGRTYLYPITAFHYF